MQNDSDPIKINPDSEIARRLREAAQSKRPVRVDTGDAVYSVVADEETAAPLPTPTPAQAAATIAAIQQASGSWSGLVDAEACKTYIRERRKAAETTQVIRRCGGRNVAFPRSLGADAHPGPPQANPSSIIVPVALLVLFESFLMLFHGRIDLRQTHRSARRIICPLP